MFDVKTLKATPGLARRLIHFSQINQMEFSEDLVDLAMQDLISLAELERTGCLLDNHELSALQHVKDWQGRAMVLTPSYEVGRRLALAHLATCDGRSLVLADPKNYLDWVNSLQEKFPDKKLSVFGNPRYKEKGQTWPLNIEFTEKPDLTADIFITSYGGLIWNNLLTSVNISQTIVEELDHAQAVNYKWQDALNGIFHEVPAPFFLQNIQNLPRDPGFDVFTSLQVGGSKTISFIMDIVTNFMWAGVGHGLMSNLLGATRQDASGYLSARGYRGDMQKLMALFGISTELVVMDRDAHKPMVFRDSTIRDLKSSRNRKGSGLNRILERETELEARTGQRIWSLVQSALKADEPSLSFLGDLQTTQWANLKAQHLKAIHTSFAHKGTRTLFVTDNRDLIRGLCLQFGPQIINMDDDPLFNAARFVYGIDHSHMSQLNWEQQRNLKPIHNLIVQPQHITNTFHLLKMADYVVMPHWVQSLNEFQHHVNAVNLNGSKLVLPYIQDTFEEHFQKELLRKSA